jgi:hypothetical protein
MWGAGAHVVIAQFVSLLASTPQASNNLVADVMGE